MGQMQFWLSYLFVIGVAHPGGRSERKIGHEPERTKPRGEPVGCSPNPTRVVAKGDADFEHAGLHASEGIAGHHPLSGNDGNNRSPGNHAARGRSSARQLRRVSCWPEKGCSQIRCRSRDRRGLGCALPSRLRFTQRSNNRCSKTRFSRQRRGVLWRANFGRTQRMKQKKAPPGTSREGSELAALLLGRLWYCLFSHLPAQNHGATSTTRK